MRRLGRRHGLDGLRAIAVAMVVVFHGWPDVFPGGILGVELFFVLSGFLITWTLLDEYAERGDIHLPAFYGRRALRLLPALGLLLAIYLGVGLVAYSSHVQRSMLRTVLIGASYTTDWLLALGIRVPGLGHLWSLAVEEQFYLLWPLLLVGLTRRGLAAKVGRVAGVLAVVSILERELLWRNGATTSRLYFAFDTRCASLLIGCALGATLACGGLHKAARPSRRLHVCAALGAAFLTLTLLRGVPALPYSSPVSAFTLAGLSGAAIVLWTVAQDGAGPGRLLDSPVARYLGRRSYGIYLWHYSLQELTRRWVSAGNEVGTVVVIAGALVVAHLSFRFVEAPALRLRHRLERRDRTAPAGTSPVAPTR